jgi:membrane protein insertase Oxa1/YidC/SpoIIIJ
MYWIPNNIFSMLQNVVLRIPAVKRVFGIPEPIAKSSADILAMRSKENAITKTIGKIFPSAVKEHKTDTSGIKLLTQEEMHKLRKKK